LRGAVEVVVEHVDKSFDDERIVALADVSFSVAAGELVALTGPSGCGKSTLLNLIGALDRPDRGTITVGGEHIDRLQNVAEYRAATVGFVFQFHNLIATLTALENVQVPMLGRLPRAERERRARDLLRQVGLEHRVASYPPTLSGGERQRVVIARSLANAPRLLLADEPTGNLDPHTAEHVFSTLVELVRATRLAALVATHNLALAERMDRRVTIEEGQVVALD
jgi:lipoprotein-releasing system ATP-binding protein